MVSSVVILVMLMVFVCSSHPHFKHYRLIDHTGTDDYNHDYHATIEEDDQPKTNGVFLIIHVFCLIFFILEFLAYLITYYLEIRRKNLPYTIKLALKQMIVFDLLTITAFGLHLASIVFLNGLISMRIFRICWFMRHWSVGKALTYICNTRQKSFMLLLMTVTTGVVFFSSWVYYAESSSEDSHFKSLLDTLYFGFITVTTVGYGDMRPISSLGKSIGAFLALLGVLFYALCAAVVIPSYLHYFRFAQYTTPSGGEVKGKDGSSTDLRKEAEDVDVPLATKSE